MKTPLSLEEGSLTAKKKEHKKNTQVAVALSLVCFVLIGLAVGLGLHYTLRDDSSSTRDQISTCTDFQWGDIPASTNGAVFLDLPCMPGAELRRCPAWFNTTPLIVLSLDGFRGSYLQRELTPVILRLSKCGVHTPSLRPIFPSNTFPNHYSIVTGLYPESHGIIDNNMYDPTTNTEFSAATSARPESQHFWKGDPIWNTAMRQNKRVATVYWGGSDAHINGMSPDICYNYDESVPFEARVEELLRLLELPDAERPDLLMSYYHQPDKAAHQTGIYNDQQFAGNLTHVDEVVGRLLDGLIERNISHCVNLLLLSDHGMAPTTSAQVVNLDERINTDEILMYDGAVTRISGKYQRNQEGQIVEKETEVPAGELLAALECSTPAMANASDSPCILLDDDYSWYTVAQHKHMLPTRYHYSNSDRIEEVVVTAKQQWTSDSAPQFPSLFYEGATHGWDPRYKDMGALFTGYGPDLVTKTMIDSFDNIQIYNLMSALLDITPSQNNGTEGSLWHVMMSPPEPTPTPPPEGSYEFPEYPDGSELPERRAASSCECPQLDELTDTDINELDAQLNLSTSGLAMSELTHLYRGRPTQTISGLDMLELTQTKYITGFSLAHGLPLWSAFNLNLSSALVTPPELNCIRADVRLTPTRAVQCDGYEQLEDIIPFYLFPAGLESVNIDREMDTYISTNVAPMYNGFVDGIWRRVVNLMREYSLKYSNVNVVVGPVYDYNHDGRADDVQMIQQHTRANNTTIAVPTHYYVILSKCENSDVRFIADCQDNELDMLSFVLPHQPTIRECHGPFLESEWMTYLSTHTARVRDIELLTGFSFFPAVGASLRPRLISNYTTALWPMRSWLDQDQCHAASCENSTTPQLVLISLDGFRPSYFDLGLTPTLSKLRTCGVSVPYMEAAFPTKTFPNHHTIATGMHPSSHGIVDNDMYDKSMNTTFYLGGPTATDTRWWGGDPIWNRVVAADKTAAAFFWPGSDIEISGGYPSHCVMYNGNVPYAQRVDTVLDWLDGSTEIHADLVTLYFSKVDTEGHNGGPEGEQVKEALPYVDLFIQQLMDGLYRRNMHQCVNIIITSDHGMSEISCDRNFQLVEYVGQNVTEVSYMYGGPNGRISTEFYSVNRDTMAPVPEEQQVSQEYVQSRLECAEPGLRSYSKRTLPKRLHYTSNDRIEETIVLLNDTYTIDSYEAWCGMAANHGWDPTYESMRAMFVGYGPSLKSETQVTEPFENLELYNLMCTMLNVPAAPNDGTDGSLHHLLSDALEIELPERGEYVAPEIPAYPRENTTYDDRADLERTGCTCNVQDIESYDLQLDIDNTTYSFLEEQHAPQGLPRYTDASMGLHLVYQTDYISQYNTHLHATEWVAAQIQHQTTQRNISQWDCLRPDVRFEMEEVATCSDYTENNQDYRHYHLFPPGFSSNESSVMDALLLSNSAVMLPGFVTNIWSRVWQYVQQVSGDEEALNVVVGPVYDYDNSGRRNDNSTIQRLGNTSISIPTHFYVILIRCANHTDNCDLMNYDVLPFVIPHTADITNCMDTETYLWDHRARLRDIERLTGLHFLTRANTQLALQAVTRLPAVMW